ncbi:MAG: glycosyltransferase family 4 protein [Prevotella sp.]|nr:glycosyltransferase family 4 protein [Prevotella sp.]
MNKKIAYFSASNFADCDLPLLHELQQRADVSYILQISDKTKQQTLINIKQIKKRGGVYPAAEFPDLQNLSKYIDLSKVYVLNMPGRHDFSPGNLWASVCLLRFLLRQHFSVIHLTWPLRYGMFLLYCLRRRMVLTMHDPLPHSSEDTRLNRFHRKTAIRLTPHFILLNSSQKKEFMSIYDIGEERVHLSRLSIYTHLLEVKPAYPACKDYVLFVGKINTHKGIDILCQAMQSLHHLHPGLKLVVAGSGKMYFDPEPYIREGFLELYNRYLSSEELAGFIGHAAFVVCPYIDATQSGVIMSVFALGKPVIATRTGGLPEMVADNRHGLIVPPKDSKALSEAIEQLVSHPQLLQQMSGHITEDYHHGNYSWERIASDYLSVYTIYKQR